MSVPSEKISPQIILQRKMVRHVLESNTRRNEVRWSFRIRSCSDLPRQRPWVNLEDETTGTPTAIIHEKKGTIIWTKPPGNYGTQPLIFRGCWTSRAMDEDMNIAYVLNKNVCVFVCFVHVFRFKTLIFIYRGLAQKLMCTSYTSSLTLCSLFQ